MFKIKKSIQTNEIVFGKLYVYIYIKKKQTETHTVANFGNLIKILAGVYVCV